MLTPTIEEIYNTQIRPRSPAERRRLIEIVEHDFHKEGCASSEEDPTLALFAKWKEEDREIWHGQMAGTEVVFAKEENNTVIITVYLAGRSK